MMPRLAAEEELLARAAAVHPYLDAKDQRSHIARLSKAAGIDEAPRKATKADIASLGIKVG